MLAWANLYFQPVCALLLSHPKNSKCSLFALIEKSQHFRQNIESIEIMTEIIEQKYRNLNIESIELFSTNLRLDLLELLIDGLTGNNLM